jgi:ABC-type sugar transport system substrate-binding protein
MKLGGRKMKKIVVLLLCAMMVFALVGCGKPSTSESQGAATSSAAASEGTSAGTGESAVTTEQGLSAIAAEAAAAANAYKNDTYFSNHENYKDFGADGVYKVAFVCKFITSSWFAPKSVGMKDKATELGIEFIGIDGNNSEDTFLQGVQNAINQDVDAIILTPVTASMLPACIDLCQEAGVAYITTDDGGYDSDGNRAPHLGLDDFWLSYSAGKAAALAAVERGFDVSKLKVAMMDAPAVESIHGRSLGAYQGMMDNIPGLTDDNFIWLDTIDNLTDNNIAKFSSAYQANTASTEYWIVFCGGNNVWDAAFPIFDENNADYSKIICSGVCGDTTIADAMSASEGKANCMFCAGILPYPSGAALIELCNDLFKNGTPFPDFTGYPEYIVSAANIDQWAIDAA